MIGPINPGSQFFTVADFSSSPSQAGVRLMSSAGATSIARSTTGLVNLGGNTRGKLLTAPTAGWYIALWDDSNGTPFSDEVVLVQATTGGVTLPPTSLSPAPGHYYIKRRDTCPPLDYQALHGTTPVDITGATTILFKMRSTVNTGSTKVNGSASILDGPNGLMRYQWISTDTDTAGDYLGEFEVTYANGCVETFPTTSDAAAEYLRVHVIPDLDAP